MTLINDAEFQLEQALLSVIAAAECFGIDPEVLRLMAVGGLTQSDLPAWVKPLHVPGAVAVLNEAVRTYTATSTTIRDASSPDIGSISSLNSE